MIARVSRVRRRFVNVALADFVQEVDILDPNWTKLFMRPIILVTLVEYLLSCATIISHRNSNLKITINCFFLSYFN